MAAERDLLAKSPFKRLIVQLPLLLQALALVLLALALARPATRGGGVPGDHLALVIDTSASMGARGPDGRTRIAEARDAAGTTDLRASTRRRRDDHRGRARAAHRLAARSRHPPPVGGHRTQSTRATSRVSSAAPVALASDRLRQIPGDDRGLRRIVVISDGALARSRSARARSAADRGDPGGQPHRQRGDRARRRAERYRSGDQARAGSSFRAARELRRTKRDLFVTLRLKNATEPLASRRLELGPAERAPVVLELRARAGRPGLRPDRGAQPGRCARSR